MLSQCCKDCDEIMSDSMDCIHYSVSQIDLYSIRLVHYLYHIHSYHLAHFSRYQINIAAADENLTKITVSQ